MSEIRVDTNLGSQNVSLTPGSILMSKDGVTLQELAPGSEGQVLTIASGVPDYADPSGGGASKMVFSRQISSASAGRYYSLSGSASGSAALTPDLYTSGTITIVPVAGTFKNAYVYGDNAAAGTNTWTLFTGFAIDGSGGSLSSISVTITSGNTGSDTTNTLHVAAGTLVAWNCEANADFGGLMIGIEFDPD